tara:strand:+ start:812 stop:985 length:174 start_codon:yes stop_codon:yes gene_type:complete
MLRSAKSLRITPVRYRTLRHAANARQGGFAESVCDHRLEKLRASIWHYLNSDQMFDI